MGKKIASFLIIFFVFILSVALVSGTSSSFFEGENSTKVNQDTNDSSMNDDFINKEPDAVLSFTSSELITNMYLSQLSSGKHVYDPETGETRVDLNDDSGLIMILPFTFPDDDMVIRLGSSVQTEIFDTFWHKRTGSLLVEDLTLRGVYQSADGSALTNAIMKDNFHIYTRLDIQSNLQQENLSCDQLNYLIDLLVCQGCFIESSVNQSFYWRPDWDSTCDDYFGNRIGMRYSVSVPYDLSVSVDSGYEYILYMFDSIGSYFCDSTVGWTSCNGSSFVIPANTPFCIALRPEGLGPGVSESDRDNYPYLYTEQWMDIIEFKASK